MNTRKMDRCEHHCVCAYICVSKSESRSVVSNSLRPHGLYTVHGILQARILEWVAFLSSRASLNLGIEPRSSTLLLLLLSHFSRVLFYATPYTGAHQAPPCPWDSPGKNTGVDYHFLLQCMKMKSEREFAQSCPTLSNPMNCSPPGSSVHGLSRQEY